MNIKDDIKASCAFVGSLVGAGFATGQEVKLFFGGSAPIVPILAGGLCGVMAFVFTLLGKEAQGNPIGVLFPECVLPWKILSVACNAFIVAAMVACAEEEIYSAFTFNGGGLLMLGMALLPAMSTGDKLLKLLNTALVPTIVALIYILFFKSESNISLNGNLNPQSAFLYSGMNMLTGGTLLANFGKNLKLKDCATIGIIPGIAVTLLLLPIYFCVSATDVVDKPLAYIATSLGLAIPGKILLLLAIYTTCAGALSAIALEGGKISLCLALPAAVCIATFGFAMIVSDIYPITGAVGIVLSTCSTIYVIYKQAKKIRQNNSKLCKRWYNNI